MLECPCARRAIGTLRIKLPADALFHCFLIAGRTTMLRFEADIPGTVFGVEVIKRVPHFVIIHQVIDLVRHGIQRQVIGRFILGDWVVSGPYDASVQVQSIVVGLAIWSIAFVVLLPLEIETGFRIQQFVECVVDYLSVSLLVVGESGNRF